LNSLIVVTKLESFKHKEQRVKIVTILKNETFKLSSHLLLKGNNNRSTILKGERMNYVQLELRKTTLAV